MNRQKDIIMLIGLICLVIFLFSWSGGLGIEHGSEPGGLAIGKNVSAADRDQPVSAPKNETADQEFLSISRFVLLSIGVLLMIRVRKISG